MPRDCRTKIVATIGPASSSPEVLTALIEAGMDGARLNLSHGTQEDHARSAQLVREVEAAAGRPIALIADLQGPKLRVGDLDADVTLATGDSIVIAGEDAAQPDDVPVSPAVLGSVLQPGNDVLVDDGLVRLRVEKVERGRARCEVLVGGVIKAHKGVNLPGVPLPIRIASESAAFVQTNCLSENAVLTFPKNGEQRRDRHEIATGQPRARLGGAAIDACILRLGGSRGRRRRQGSGR